VDASKGELKLEGSFLSIEGATVVPTALKRSEDGPEWILRMYESSGVHTEASVKGVLRAERVTFIEDKAGDADPARVPLRGYQIETLRLRMKE
jgi:alpha-mannosidase